MHTCFILASRPLRSRIRQIKGPKPRPETQYQKFVKEKIATLSRQHPRTPGKQLIRMAADEWQKHKSALKMREEESGAQAEGSDGGEEEEDGAEEQDSPPPSRHPVFDLDLSP